MKKTNAAGDVTSSRLIDQDTFQASILALHAAIASAGKELKNPLEEFGAGQYSDDPLHSPVERARRPSEGAKSLNRPDPRGF